MLRGTTVQNGEYYSAKYYDIVPKRDNEGKIVYKNNKIEYTIDMNPYEFNFREREVGSGNAYYANYRAFSRTIDEIGNIQTNSIKYIIYTSNSNVPFKIGGKVVFYWNDKQIITTVLKTSRNSNFQNTLANTRFKSISDNYMPLFLELA